MSSSIETALLALKTLFTGASGLPDVRRNAVLDALFDEVTGNDSKKYFRALILRDGETELAERALGGRQFMLTHTAQLEWIVAGPEGDVLDAMFDAGLVAIDGLMVANPQIGGATLAELSQPPQRDFDIAGANPMKMATIPLTLTLASTRPF